MRILLLTQWFYPEPNFKVFPFAKELQKRGHEVEVLTGFPNYPNGRLYDGYSISFFQREVIEGIPVLRIPLYPSHDTSNVRRILNYTSFALSSALLGPLLIKPADVVYVYHPPATIGLPAVVIHLLRRTPFVYDIQDLWPDTLKASGMLNNPGVLWMVDRWCQFVYRMANRIVVLSPGFKDELVKRGVSPRKIEVVYNWCDDGQVHSEGRDETLARELGLAGRFNVIFAGTMGKVQALDAVLDAAKLIADSLPIAQFVFVGGGIDVERLKKKANGMRLKNVIFLPPRSLSDIGKILTLADVLLVHLKDDPLFSITIPSKTQAYLAIGKPIIAGVRGNCSELVEKAGAGISCTPEYPKSIAEAVAIMFAKPRGELEAMGENGRSFYERELSLSVGISRFEEIFQSVIIGENKCQIGK